MKLNRFHRAEVDARSDDLEDRRAAIVATNTFPVASTATPIGWLKPLPSEMMVGDAGMLPSTARSSLFRRVVMCIADKDISADVHRYALGLVESTRPASLTQAELEQPGVISLTVASP